MLKDNLPIEQIEPQKVIFALMETDGLAPVLDRIKKIVEDHLPDVTTAKGRKEIKALGASINKSKRYIDDIGKDSVAERKAALKLIDNERKKFREGCDAMRVGALAPLVEYEATESARIAKHQAVLEYLGLPFDTLSIDDLEQRVVDFANTDTAGMEEFKAEADRILSSTMLAMNTRREDLLDRKKKDDEIEAHRKQILEQERQIRESKLIREAEDRARVAAEAKARHEAQEVERAKFDAERRERDAEERAKVAEKQVAAAKVAAEAHAVKLAADKQEWARQAADDARDAAIADAKAAQEREDAELASRQANALHCKEIRVCARDAMVAHGIDASTAVDILKLIHLGKVPRVRLEY